MKNNVHIYITILCTISFNIYSQGIELNEVENKMDTNQLHKTISEKSPNSVRTVKSYHVVENVNMNFGGHTTTYIVSDIALVNTYDLGPNNTRVVTTLYTKKQKAEEKQPSVYQPNTLTKTINTTVTPYNKIGVKDLVITKNPISTELSIAIEYPDESIGVAYIDILDNYERVVEKGYKSIDIFKRLGNKYYFKGELEKAAKFYSELFVMTSDLDPEYYYRYAQSLISIRKNDTANKMMLIYEQKTQAIAEKHKI